MISWYCQSSWLTAWLLLYNGKCNRNCYNATTISTEKDVVLSIVLAEYKYLMTFSVPDNYLCYRILLCKVVLSQSYFSQSQTSHQENHAFYVFCDSVCHHVRNRYHSVIFYNDFCHDRHDYNCFGFAYFLYLSSIVPHASAWRTKIGINIVSLHSMHLSWEIWTLNMLNVYHVVRDHTQIFHLKWMYTVCYILILMLRTTIIFIIALYLSTQNFISKGF